MKKDAIKKWGEKLIEILRKKLSGQWDAWLKGDHFGGARFTVKEQTVLIKRLAYLLEAGVPLEESLSMLQSQMRSKQHARALAEVSRSVAGGHSLSESVAAQPKLLGAFGVHLIRVGEQSGTLAQSLTYLAEELTKKQLLRRKVVGAFIYPAVIMVATLGIAGFLLTYLFPKIMPVFVSLHITLPVTTRMVIALSTFITEWGLLSIGLIGVGVVFATVMLRKNTRVRFLFQNALMRLPLLGAMMRDYYVASGSRTLGLLLKSGVPLHEALHTTADTTVQLVYKKRWHDLGESIRQGTTMSYLLQNEHLLFPEIFAHLVMVGE